MTFSFSFTIPYNLSFLFNKLIFLLQSEKIFFKNWPTLTIISFYACWGIPVWLKWCWFSLLMFSTSQFLPKFHLFNSLMFVSYLYFSGTIDITILRAIIKEMHREMKLLNCNDCNRHGHLAGPRLIEEVSILQAGDAGYTLQSLLYVELAMWSMRPKVLDAKWDSVKFFNFLVEISNLTGKALFSLRLFSQLWGYEFCSCSSCFAKLRIQVRERSRRVWP